MSIINQKKKVFGNIAAFRTLTEGMPKLKLNSSFPSINNNGDSIAFLCDLVKALVGYEALQETITDTLVYGLNDIEIEIKNSLKTELKSIVSCGIDPSLPDFIKSSGTGIKYTVDKVDFTGLMFINPNSDNGKLLYNDITPTLLDSTDFNTYLYKTIQDDGTPTTWGQSTLQRDILTFLYKSIDVSQTDPNNTITVRAHPSYDTKTLTDLNNDYIDSVKLFNTEKLLSNTIDMGFGTISKASNKTIKQLIAEAKINTVIDRIKNSDSKDIINDKYFDFSNTEQFQQQATATARKKGEKVLDTSTTLVTSIPISSINSLNTNIGSAPTPILKKEAVTNSLNQIGNQLAAFSKNAADHKAIKLNFIQELIDNLIKAIVNGLLSPKVVSIFIINYKIVYGQNSTYTDSVDFLKKNKNLIHGITKKITGLIIKALLNVALKRITQLVSEGVAKQQIDKSQSNLQQLLSLVGVPQDALRQIKGLL